MNTLTNLQVDALFALRLAAWRAFLACPNAATRAAHMAARDACFGNPPNGHR